MLPQQCALKRRTITHVLNKTTFSPLKALKSLIILISSRFTRFIQTWLQVALRNFFCNILKLLNITTANLIIVHKKETMEDFCFYSRIYKKIFYFRFFDSDVPKPFLGFTNSIKNVIR